MIVRGDKLSVKVQQEVLQAFPHRWTFENAKRRGVDCIGCCDQFLTSWTFPTIEEWHAHHAPIVSDAQWLKEHAFYVTKDGSRLKRNRHYCEPASFDGMED